jgi:hypothetical protein
MTAWLSEFSAYLSSDQRVKERAVQQYACPFREHLGIFQGPYPQKLDPYSIITTQHVLIHNTCMSSSHKRLEDILQPQKNFL